MHLDRALGDIELGRDLPVDQTLDEMTEDLTLARGETLVLRQERLPSCEDGTVCRPLGHRPAHRLNQDALFNRLGDDAFRRIRRKVREQLSTRRIRPYGEARRRQQSSSGLRVGSSSSTT